MVQAEDVDSGADQRDVVDTISNDVEDIMRRENEITERLDAIALEHNRIFQEFDVLISRVDALLLEEERIEDERQNLRDELDDIYDMSPTDQNEQADTTTDDRRDNIWRSLDATDLESSRLDQEQDEIKIRTDALSQEKSQLEQEEEDLRQEQDELRRKWETLMDLGPKDQDENAEPSTDEEDSTGELDDDMHLALSQRASALCSICRNFPQGRIEVTDLDTSSRLYHPSLSSLQNSVDAGCTLCESLAESVENFCNKSDPPATRKDFWSIRCRITDGHGRSLMLWFLLCQCELGHPDDSGCELAEQLGGREFLPARKLSLGPEFLDPTIRTSSAKSAASFAVARSWYQKCLTHETCRNWRREKRVLPTRLIQIRGPDRSRSYLSARLCETKGLPTSTPYTSLSHCWGKCVLFRLLTGNLEDLKQAIPIGQLPKVFQDAIHVSFELGIRYLWIDSLCIVQDSKEDWTYEAKRMGDVYLHSEFNISATAYEDGSLGLFGERKALPLVHFPLYVDFVLVHKYYETKTAFKGIYVRWNDAEFSDKIHMAVLFSRAWVAQERALSPAILHYTREKIWWECNQEILSEAVTENPYLDGRLIWEQTEGSGRDRVRSLSTKSEPEEVYSFWKKFLSKHGGAFLTFYRDRFPAMAGLSNILGELIDDDLVAGFWSGDLIRSLIMTRASTRAAIQPELIAPTWSWASLCSTPIPVGVDEAQIKPIDGVRVIKVLSDVPGFKSDLQSTHVETSAVRGLAIRGVLRRLPEDFDPQQDWLPQKKWARPEWISDVTTISDHRTSCLLGREKIPEEQKWRLEPPTHMLLLATERADSHSREYVYGLLVQIADEPNTFRRTGTIEFAGKMEAKWDEYFGLGDKDTEEEEAGSGIEERGLQDIVLI